MLAVAHINVILFFVMLCRYVGRFSNTDLSILLGFKALFNSLPPEDYVGGTLVLGGDGRYFNREAAQVPLEMKHELTCVCCTFVYAYLCPLLLWECRLSLRLRQEMVLGRSSLAGE